MAVHSTDRERKSADRKPSLGELIHAACRERRLTDLAHEVGVSDGHLCRMRYDRVHSLSEAAIAGLSRALGISRGAVLLAMNETNRRRPLPVRTGARHAAT